MTKILSCWLRPQAEEIAVKYLFQRTQQNDPSKFRTNHANAIDTALSITRPRCRLVDEKLKSTSLSYVWFGLTIRKARIN